MKHQTCQNCIYAVQLTGSTAAILVCTNKADSDGQLHLAEEKGLCRNFQKQRRVHRPKPPQPKHSNIRFIPLTKGKVAIVDAEDYDWLSKYKWYACKRKYTYYAYRWQNHHAIAMHRVIINAPEGMLVDHIDRNGLNNRRSNLRLCKALQNAANQPPRGGTSKYKGVHWSKSNNKWVTAITFREKYLYLGSFNDQIDAAKAYDKKAAELFGEFAYLNFPEKKPIIG